MFCHTHICLQCILSVCICISKIGYELGFAAYLRRFILFYSDISSDIPVLLQNDYIFAKFLFPLLQYFTNFCII